MGNTYSTALAPRIFLHKYDLSTLPSLWEKDRSPEFTPPKEQWASYTNKIYLTKYCTNCDYSASIYPPYGSASITLRIPPEEIEDLLELRPGTSIETGSWITIESKGDFLDSDAQTSSFSNQLSVVFYGRVSSVQQSLAIAIDDGVPFSEITINVAHFFSPFMLAQTRRTPLRVGKIKEIHPAAIGEAQTKNNVILAGLERFAETRSDESIEVALQYFLDALGHFAYYVPPSPTKSPIKVVAQVGFDKIQGRPAPSYYTSAFRQRTATMWGILQSIFLPNQDMLEMFPRLEHTSLEHLKEGMAMVYRYKPVNPTVDVPPGAYASTFFGKRAPKEHLKIEEKIVSSISLSWSEGSRINAINLSIPFEIGEGGDSLLFGVGCSPVFDQIDINTNGLRMYTANTPFIAQGSQPDKIALYNTKAPSALAERLYLLLGEGEKYASGTITCLYDAALISYIGSWAEISTKKMKLTFYITNVRNSFAVDPMSGVPIARSFIEVERASYGDHSPNFEPQQVKIQTTAPRKTNPKKKKTDRKKTK